MTEIDVVLQEHRKFEPPAKFRENALVSDHSLYKVPAEAFWESQANELEWFEKWRTVCEWKPPYAKWFLGGKINISVNCVDRHVRGPRRNKAALLWEG